MPYKFQKRIVRSNDVLDVDQMRQDLGDAAEQISTGLNEHAFASRNNDLLIEDSALCELESISTNAPVGFGTTAPHTGPPSLSTGWATSSPGSVVIPNSNVWEVIETETFTSETPEILHLLGKCNYGWTGYKPNAGGSAPNTAGQPYHEHGYNQDWDPRELSSGLTPQDQPWDPPNVQFALRVNGVIYNKTGHRNPHYRAYQPLKAGRSWYAYPISARTNKGGWPGTLSVKTEEMGGPGRWLMSVGFDQIVYVPPGTTKVEIIAIRLNRRKQHKYAANDTIAALTRTLSIIRYFPKKQRSRTTVAVNYTAPKLGDTINDTNLSTNGVQQHASALNALTDDHINSLNRYHAPTVLVKESGVLQANWAGWTPSSAITVENFCPGETTSTFGALGTFTGATAWTPLYDAPDEFLLQTSDQSAIPASSRYGKIVLWGSVYVKRIQAKSGDIITNIRDPQHMAVVGIYYKQGSTRTLINQSVVPVSRVSTPKSSETYLTVATNRINDRVRVPLHAELDLTSSLLGSDIDGFGVCVATINCNSTNAVEMEVGLASLSFEFYRK